jgi:hypothetical protein
MGEKPLCMDGAKELCFGSELKGDLRQACAFSREALTLWLRYSCPSTYSIYECYSWNQAV